MSDTRARRLLGKRAKKSYSRGSIAGDDAFKRRKREKEATEDAVDARAQTCWKTCASSCEWNEWGITQSSTCRSAQRHRCQARCDAGQPHSAHPDCLSTCTEDPLQACEPLSRDACEEICSRRRCVDGVCVCPVAFEAHPLCTKPHRLAALLPTPQRVCANDIYHALRPQPAIPAQPADANAATLHGVAAEPTALPRQGGPLHPSSSANQIAPSMGASNSGSGPAAANATADAPSALTTFQPQNTAGISPRILAARAPVGAKIRGHSRLATLPALDDGALAPDLPDLIDFSSCAIVGSSHAMQASRLGRDIDAHTAVIRFNEAPTFQHEEDVGSATHLRIQNRKYCGFSEHPHELCLHYTGWEGHECGGGSNRKWRTQTGFNSTCTMLPLHPAVLRYVQNFWDPKALGPLKSERDGSTLSAGYFAVMLAVSLCGKLDLYGLTQSENHYYQKLSNSRNKFGQRHKWSLEQSCTRALAQLPGVRMTESFQDDDDTDLL